MKVKVKDTYAPAHSDEFVERTQSAPGHPKSHRSLSLLLVLGATPDSIFPAAAAFYGPTRDKLGPLQTNHGYQV